MNQVPTYISVVFILITFLTVFLFYKASGNNRTLLLILFSWMAVQGVVAATGFFTVTNTTPPRFIVLLALPLAGITVVLLRSKGNAFVERFDPKRLMLLHTIRIAVEIVLFLLFLNKVMPKLMTFEGRNFDLVAGLSAPFVYYYGFVKRKIGAAGIVAWNIISIGVLLFTVGNAILSAPTPFQKFGFEQPTIAVLYFPFVWLPGAVVPIVIMSHLITIRWFLNTKASTAFLLNAVAK